MARSFNGSTDKIAIANNPALTFASPGTISAWVNLQNVSTPAIQQVFAFTGSTLYGIFFRVSQVDFEGQTNAANAPGSTARSTGVWYHVCFVVGAAAGGGQLYVNGVQAGNNGACAWAVPSAASGGIGFDPANAGRNFSGYIADTAVWNAALGLNEVDALLRGVRPSSVRPLSLRGWWPLDGYNHPALDRAFDKNNGVLTGTAFIPGPPLISASPIFVRQNLQSSAVAAGNIVFRKTLSSLGTRTGSRQAVGTT